MVANEVTVILRAIGDGHESAVEALFPLVYDELRSQASRLMRREKHQITLQPTALVHEAYVKLVGNEDANWQDRAHFCRIAARAMRQILIDQARKRNAAKRGQGNERVTLSDAVSMASGEPLDLMALDQALVRLAELSERQARIVELRFFGGLNVREVATVLDLSVSTVESDWRMARAWLHQELAGDSLA